MLELAAMNTYKNLAGKQEMPLIRFRLAFFLTLPCFLLISCTPSYYIAERDTILFKGDVSPIVSSKKALAGDLSNLSEGEATVIAIAKDGTGALSQPGTVSANITETVLIERDFDDSLETIMLKCDPDSDGIFDIFCIDLLAFLKSGALSKYKGSDTLFNQKFVTFQTQYSIGREPRRNAADFAQKEITMDIADESETDLYLNILTINRGNKIFDGDLVIHANIPPQVKFLKVTQTDKIRDNLSLKTTLMSIPIIQLFALALNDFAVVSSKAIFTSTTTEDGNLKLTAENIRLAPGEGVNLGYRVAYKTEGI